jgi:hypothetical protein
MQPRTALSTDPPHAAKAQLTVGIGAGVSGGTTPRVAGDALLEAAFRLRYLSVGATARLAVGPEGIFDGRRASASYAVVLLVPCASVPLLPRLRADFCALVGAGALLVDTVNTDGRRGPRSRTAPLGTGGVRLGLSTPLTPRVSLRLQGDGLFHPIPHAMRSEGRSLWHTAPIAFGVHLVALAALDLF